ncbi:MAG: 5-formyltetrahydrofolate cyclo-ligase [Burkholderiaceae bacterium]
MSQDLSIACGAGSQPVWPGERDAARTAILQWRRGLSPAQRKTRSERIAALLDPWLAQAHADLVTRIATPVLGVYWPIRGEPDLTASFELWIKAGWTVALPVTPPAPGPLAYRRFEPGQAMLTDKMGIATPPPSEPIVPDRIIAPCVGFSPNGYRLGYGGGYYDRTLEVIAGTAVGVAYHETQLETFAPASHDQPFSAIATDRQWIRQG